MKNVDEKDIKKADNEAADTTTDANAANTDNKDADTVETQGSSDADVKEDGQSFNASDAKGAEETVDINNNKKDQKDALLEDLNDRLKASDGWSLTTTESVLTKKSQQCLRWEHRML